MMSKEKQMFPEMSLHDLFATARAAGKKPDVIALSADFRFSGCGIDHGTLTVTRNPQSRRWLATVGISQVQAYSARFAHGETAGEALDRVEQQCSEWML
jgi:hypothetical protein